MTDQEVIAMLVDLGYESTTITFDTSGSTDNDVIVVALKDLRNFENEWQHLRSLVPETKRWPMGCITEWSLRQGFAGDGTASAHETLRIAQHYDSDAVFADYEPSAYRFLSFDPDLTVLTKSLGLDPQILERWIQEGHAELGFLASRRDIERWLVRKQIEEGVHALPHESSWYDGAGWSPTAIAMLPTADPTAGLAYVSAAFNPPMESVALARRWANDHAVEVVAGMGCGYWFQMPEPIADPDAAWRLAIEILYLWDSSSGGTAAGVSPLELAPMLTRVTKFDGTQLP